MNKDTEDTLALMDAKRIERSLKRIAHQVAEDNKASKELVLLGINKRGYAVSEMLCRYLKELLDNPIACSRLKVKKNSSSNTDFSLQGKYVLLVDDVIFSGTTMFEALKLITRDHAPDEVHTVTLVDRGHRKYPIIARFVGLDLPTKLDEHVHLELKNGEPFTVILEKSLH